ncbi:hypothetical protein EHS25_004532 [Saitozyma podzolica]|uniref:Uncharacterized protein n=1 Tax=Saitozyma podzolica TaxID=1890683 RepID=A0A427YUF7_9TREE|nr:hypothetical protein EHS25_004532 [Saitozyma podzolica]
MQHYEYAEEHRTVTPYHGGSCFSWAECVEGKSFKVVLVRNRNKGKRFAVEARLSINGRRIDDAAWFASERECGFEGMYETKQDGLHKLPLVFAPQASTCLKAIIMLYTTEDICDANMRNLALMSTISVTLHRGTYKQAPPDNDTRIPGDRIQTVYEKHSNGGEGVMVEEAEPFELHYFYPAKNSPETLYEFRWKYGVKDKLIVAKIIPDPTSTLPRLATKRMRRPAVNAVESDDSGTPAPFTSQSPTRTEDPQQHLSMPPFAGEAKRKKKRRMGAGYSKTRLDGKLHGEEGGVDNPMTSPR